MNILVINAGSSSLKYQLVDMNNESVMAKGNVERIGIAGSTLKHKYADQAVEIVKDIPNHVEAIKLVLDTLVDPNHGVISDMAEIDAVGHRVLHGGESFSGSVLINDSVMEAIKANVDLAPLHNPANIMGIEACIEVMKDVPMVAVFDTAFHQSMPKHAFMYALPYADYSELKVRRYGFHGTSHKYVSDRAAAFLNKPLSDLKIVTCHLGNGSSIAAVNGGKSVDTSMGFTPLEGLPMGTRSGNLDPAIIEYLCDKKGMSVAEAMTYLNKKSGMLGISGISSDFRDLLAAINEGNEQAKLALDVFTYSVKKFIGAYAAAMGGLDAVVFTAGVGENNPIIRGMCVEGLEFMGIKLDDAANRNAQGVDACISAADASVKVLVLPTNEEIVIARDTLALASK